MSLDSRADIIPYERFLDVRQRRQAIAAATGTLTPPPADLSPESPNAMLGGAGVAVEAEAAKGPSDRPPATRATCP
jgi:hypothetical protein